MKITKYGHACLLIEEGGVRILTDPGNYSTGQNVARNIDIILITHEHLDHVDPASLKAVLTNNPAAKVITNKSVQRLLAKEGTETEVVEESEEFTLKEVSIRGQGRDHAIFHSSIPCIRNTGYFINNFFYPGDAFTRPKYPVEILALPVAGLWMKLPEALDYALDIKPKICFPVHDAVLKVPGFTHIVPSKVLEPASIPFKILEIGKEYEF